MNKSQKNFMLVAAIAIVISFVISFSYHKYQDRKLEKKVQEFKNTILSEAPKEEKSWITKIKESIFGTKEEKIANELDKKVKEVMEIEQEFSKEMDNSKKELLSQEFKKVSEEVVKLQEMYHSITGTYYETTIEKELSKEREKEKIKEENKQTLEPEEAFREELKNTYISKGFSLKNTSFFQKTKNFLGANKVENLVNGNQSVKITYDENKTLVEEFADDKVIREIEYKTEDNYNIVHARIDNKEKAFIRTLENIKTGFGIDEFTDGSRIEFRHENQLPTGPAVRYYTNGDREEFIYRNGKKHGFSTYYFVNGDKEEVYYIEDILQGKAKYTFADGYVEIYMYKDGKREE